MRTGEISRFAAALVLGAAVMASGVGALAQGYGRDRDYEAQERGRYERGRDYEAQERGRYERGRVYDAQEQDRGRGRYDDVPRSGRYEDARRAQEEREGDGGRYRAVPVAPAGPGVWRRGQYLPPEVRGYRVPDLGRYRLRAPPPGYDWVTVGPDIYLMQRNSGLVLEAVPGGY